MTTRAEYQDYLRSEHWQDVRRRFRASKLHNGGCYICGSSERLNLHHKSYTRLGHERLNDLIYLCEPCHAHLHKLLRQSKHSKSDLWSAARKLRKQHKTSADNDK